MGGNTDTKTSTTGSTMHTEGRCIPNFFVIGVVKGGTTSLYHYLLQHPDIYLPPIKETNHFSQADMAPAHFLPTYKRDVALDLKRYIARGMKEVIHIAHVDDRLQYEQLFSGVQGEAAVGEISNSYMVCPSASQAIHSFNPKARLIVILRNPIQRAWSQYLMNLREAKTATPDFLTEIQDDSQAERQGWGVSHQYLRLGHYASQLAAYRNLFSPDQLLVLFYEDYRRAPDATMKTICKFLGVRSDFTFDFSEKSNTSSLPRSAFLNRILVNSGVLSGAKRIVPRSIRKQITGLLYSSAALPTLNKAEIDYLKSYYAEEVAALGELVQQDLSKVWSEFK